MGWVGAHKEEVGGAPSSSKRRYSAMWQPTPYSQRRGREERGRDVTKNSKRIIMAGLRVTARITGSISIPPQSAV